MAARGHFVFPIDDKNHRVLVIWDLNGYGEYEFERCICDIHVYFVNVMTHVIALKGDNLVRGHWILLHHPGDRHQTNRIYIDQPGSLLQVIMIH